jgi:hypothetical protein
MSYIRQSLKSKGATTTTTTTATATTTTTTTTTVTSRVNHIYRTVRIHTFWKNMHLTSVLYI